MSFENENHPIPQEPENGAAGPDPQMEPSIPDPVIPDPVIPDPEPIPPVSEFTWDDAQSQSAGAEAPAEEVPAGQPQEMSYTDYQQQQAEPQEYVYQPVDTYQQSGEYFQQGMEPQPPKKKNTKSLIIIAATVCVIVAAVVIAIVLGFGSGGSDSNYVKVPSRTGDPEGYLSATLHNTVQDLGPSSRIVDFSRFTGKAVAHEFKLSFDLQDLIGSYLGPTVSQLEISGDLKYSSEAQKMLLNLAVNAGFVNFKDNQVYVSPELVAFSIPTVFNRYKYVTIDPATFAEDYEDSIFYSPYNELPEDFDLQKVIIALFTNTDTGEDSDYANFYSQIDKHWADFKAAGVFSDDGTATETVGGVSKQVSKMSYTYPAGDVDRLYGNFLDEYEEIMLAQLEAMALVDPYTFYYSSPEEMVAEVMKEFDAIEFEKDLVIRYTIDADDKVVGIKMDKLTLTYRNSYSDEYEEYQIDFSLDLTGQENVWDEFKMDVVLYSNKYDESVELILKKTSSDQDGTIKAKYDLEAIDPYGTSTNMYLDLEWTPDNTEDKNLRITLEGGDGYGTAGLRFTGTLVDNKDEVSLSGGQLSFYDDYSSYTFGLDYKIYIISPSDIKIDTSDSIGFSSLSESDFSSLFY